MIAGWNHLRSSRPKLAAGVLLLLTLVACSRAGSDLGDVTILVTVAPDPPQIGPARITVDLQTAGGQPLVEADVQLEGNMSHAGMVPVFAPAEEVAPGHYQGDLEFTMSGDWYILVHAELPDGRSLEHKVDLPGVGVYFSDTPSP